MFEQSGLYDGNASGTASTTFDGVVAVTPLWRVWEAVAEIAAEAGVQPAESELIGLAPLAALLDVADHAGAPADIAVEERLAVAAGFLRLRDFSPTQALELRLAAAGRAQG